jgi:hypothetical protein
MTKRSGFLAGGAALLAAALFLSARVVSQEKGEAQPSKEEEMMAKWLALNAKGPEHAKLAKAVGTWDTVMKMWMAPGTEPTVSRGTAEFRLLLDGRYLEQKYKCEMPEGAFEGLGIEGYDRVKNRYVSVWMDNMSTGIFMSEGTADETGKVFTYYGKMDDPFTGQKDKVVKSVAREIDPGKVIFEMYDNIPGVGEFKSMEITYTRKK